MRGTKSSSMVELFLHFLLEEEDEVDVLPVLAVGGGGPADDGGELYSVFVPALYLHSALSSKYRLKWAGSYCREARDLRKWFPW
jgi:hypothetical protein